MEEETIPNISSMSDQELRELIDKLTAEEQEVSYQRRILHGHSDGSSLIKGDDVEKLSEFLAGKTQPPTKPPS
ncbi:hypothetical protein BH20ACT15_BH20ACT15_01110 [soil metagenome]